VTVPGLPVTHEQIQEAQAALRAHNGNQSHAAASLKLNRSTFMNRLHAAGVTRPEPVPRDVEMESLRKQLREAQAGQSMERWAQSIVMGMDEKAKVLRPATWTAHEAGTSPAGIPTLMLSDLHWGEVVLPEEVGHVNSYNMAIAQRRLHTVVNKTKSLLRDHVVGDYPGIVVNLGGDMVSGVIHDELERTNDGTIMEQALNLYEHLLAAILQLADEFGRVHLPCVTGNHGRSNRKWAAKQRATLSYEWLVYQFLARATAKDERISWQIPEGPDADYDLLGTGYKLTHGDTFRGGDGIIGPIGPVTRGALKRGRMAGSMGQPFSVMVIGHWHTLTWGNNFIINGTTKGFDEFAMSLSITPEPPSQALWLTTAKHGRTILLPVYAE
jgi:hypothetical protein